MNIRHELIKVAKTLSAIEFDTQDALNKYLKEHPKANKSKHSVKENTKDKPSNEDKKEQVKEDVKEKIKEKLENKEFKNMSTKEVVEHVTKQIEKTPETKSVFKKAISKVSGKLKDFAQNQLNSIKTNNTERYNPNKEMEEKLATFVVGMSSIAGGLISGIPSNSALTGAAVGVGCFVAAAAAFNVKDIAKTTAKTLRNSMDTIKKWADGTNKKSSIKTSEEEIPDDVVEAIMDMINAINNDPMTKKKIEELHKEGKLEKYFN